MSRPTYIGIARIAASDAHLQCTVVTPEQPTVDDCIDALAACCVRERFVPEAAWVCVGPYPEIATAMCDSAEILPPLLARIARNTLAML